MDRKTEHEIVVIAERLRDDAIKAFDAEAPDEWLKIAIDDVRLRLEMALEDYLEKRRRK